MGMEAINGYGPLIQQTQPQVRTQVQEQNQSQSEIVNFEANGSAQATELKVEAVDNSSYAGNDKGTALDYKKAKENREATEEQIQADNAKIKKAISEMSQKMSSNAEAVFGIHDKTNRVTIKIVDKDTKKVVKEFPPEKTLDMIAKAWELAGLLVDERR